MNILPSYTHIVNSKLKHIYLSFDAQGTLVIKSPKVSRKRIEQLLIKKSVWINKSRKKLEQKKGKALDFSQTLKLYYQGNIYPLELVHYAKKRVCLDFDGHIFKLFYHDYDERLFQNHIDNFYKKEAQKQIPEYVNMWADIMKVTPNKLSFRKTKRQWGSCSGKNDLSFNTMIMKLPSDVIQYIVVHELAHITHKHHQKSFWGLVEQYLPEYKKQVKELKDYVT
jgi:predicted metal-dependent hydrolase